MRLSLTRRFLPTPADPTCDATCWQEAFAQVHDLIELRRSGLVFLRLSRCSLTKHLRKTLQGLYGRRLA